MLISRFSYRGNNDSYIMELWEKLDLLNETLCKWEIHRNYEAAL